MEHWPEERADQHHSLLRYGVIRENAQTLQTGTHLLNQRHHQLAILQRLVYASCASETPTQFDDQSGHVLQFAPNELTVRLLREHRQVVRQTLLAHPLFDA